MDMMGIRRAVLMNSNYPLPPGYKRVEYLQSSGAQFIIIPNAFVLNKEYEMVCQASTRSDTGVIISCGVASAGNWFGYASGYYGVGGSIKLSNVTITDKIKANIVKTNGTSIKIICGEETISRTGTDNGNRTLCLFADALRNNYYAYVKIFSVKADGIVNLIPCIRKSDGKPGMYDMVSNTFYTNAGTGEFVIPT